MTDKEKFERALQDKAEWNLASMAVPVRGWYDNDSRHVFDRVDSLENLVAKMAMALYTAKVLTKEQIAEIYGVNLD